MPRSMLVSSALALVLVAPTAARAAGWGLRLENDELAAFPASSATCSLSALAVFDDARAVLRKGDQARAVAELRDIARECAAATRVLAFIASREKTPELVSSLTEDGNPVTSAFAAWATGDVYGEEMAIARIHAEQVARPLSRFVAALRLDAQGMADPSHGYAREADTSGDLLASAMAARVSWYEFLDAPLAARHCRFLSAALPDLRQLPPSTLLACLSSTLHADADAAGPFVRAFREGGPVHGDECPARVLAQQFAYVGRGEEAWALFQSADLSRCTDADGFRRWLALWTGRYDEAIASPEAVKTDRARLVRGLALAACGRVGEARSSLSAVQKSDFADQARVAEVFLNLKMPPEVFPRVIPRIPASGPELVGSSIYKYFRVGSLDEALDRFAGALATDASRSQDLWSVVLWRLVEAKAHDDVKRLGEALEKRGIQGPNVSWAQARSRRDAHDCGGALPLYRKALEQAPDLNMAMEMLECAKKGGTPEELAAFNPLRPPGEREDPDDPWSTAAFVAVCAFAVGGWLMGLAVLSWLFARRRRRARAVLPAA